MAWGVLAVSLPGCLQGASVEPATGRSAPASPCVPDAAVRAFHADVARRLVSLMAESERETYPRLRSVVRITIAFNPAGRPASISIAGDLPPEFDRILRTKIDQTRFQAPPNGSAVVRLELTSTSQSRS